VDVSFLSFLVGVIDGDGYIPARKKSNGYIEFNLVITFQNRDLATFEYILSKLHFGVIAKINPTLSKLVIYNFELKYVLVPLLLKHGLFFLTENRINQYNLLLYTLENNVKK
jgi:phosphoribulokinase